MSQINIEIHNAILRNDIDMLHFILENIIRNNNIEAFIDLIIELTHLNTSYYHSDDLFDFFVYAINSINLNQDYNIYIFLYTIASYYISWIKSEISGRNGDDPELYRPYINALFDNYIDMDKSEVSVNVLLETVCEAVSMTVAKPPLSVPLCTLSVLSVVSTEISPTAPVNTSFWAVVPLLNCTTVGI